MVCCSELRAKDLERLEGLFTDARQREKKKATKEVKEELETLNKIKELLESGKDVRCCLASLRCSINASITHVCADTAPLGQHVACCSSVLGACVAIQLDACAG